MTAAASQVLTAASAHTGPGHAEPDLVALCTLHVSRSGDGVWRRLADERMRSHETAARAVLEGSSEQRFLTLLEGARPMAA